MKDKTNEKFKVSFFTYEPVYENIDGSAPRGYKPAINSEGEEGFILEPEEIAKGDNIETRYLSTNIELGETVDFRDILEKDDISKIWFDQYKNRTGHIHYYNERKEEGFFPELKMPFCIEKVENSEFPLDIYITGNLDFEDDHIFAGTINEQLKEGLIAKFTHPGQAWTIGGTEQGEIYGVNKQHLIKDKDGENKSYFALGRINKSDVENPSGELFRRKFITNYASVFFEGIASSPRCDPQKIKIELIGPDNKPKVTRVVSLEEMLE